MYTDPSGMCPEPPAGSGDVICVDLFIAAARIAAWTGHGDGRDFSPRSLPDKSRGYIYIYLDKDGKIANDPFTHISSSCLIGGGCFGPYPEYNHINASQSANGQIQITWDLLNGVSGSFRNISENLDTGDPGDLPGQFLAWCFSKALAGIDGTIVLGRNEYGEWQLDSMDRDPYPSLEVYHYKDGKPWSTIVLDREAEFGPTFNLTPMAPNRHEPNWRAHPSVLTDPPARWYGSPSGPLPPGFVNPIYNPPPVQPISG